MPLVQSRQAGTVCVSAHRMCYRNKRGRDVESNDRNGGNSLPSVVQETIKVCPVSSTCALQAGAAQPPRTASVCSPTPYLLIQPLQRQTGVFVLKLRLPEGTEGRAEVTSAEQRWERGREVSELPSSHRKHGIEENELQGAGEVLFFLVFLYIPESVAATAHSSTSPSEKH